MTTHKEALTLALEALDYAGYLTEPEGDFGCNCLICQATAAVKEALAQPEQEPVAHIPLKALEQIKPPTLVLNNVPIYGYSAEGTVAVYTMSPQRKPLTRGQIREIEVDVSLNPSFEYITPAEQLCRAIEAAHGIKD